MCACVIQTYNVEKIYSKQIDYFNLVEEDYINGARRVFVASRDNFQIATVYLPCQNKSVCLYL